MRKVSATFVHIAVTYITCLACVRIFDVYDHPRTIYGYVCCDAHNEIDYAKTSGLPTSKTSRWLERQNFRGDTFFGKLREKKKEEASECHIFIFDG